MLSSAHRAPRLMCSLVEALLSAACFRSLSAWFTMFHDWLGPAATYDARPSWLVVLMAAITVLPWIALMTMVLLRRWRGPGYRLLAFGVGLLMPYV